jgi:hypothetical protein
MPDGDFRIREREIPVVGLVLAAVGRVPRWVLGVIGALGAMACSKPTPKSPTTQSAATVAPVTATPAVCPATGQWATCSIMYRLGRSGLAATIDSSAKPQESQLGGQSLMVTLGRSDLELHVFPDSLARVAAVAKLDRTQFVNATAEQTIRRERTLIESVNLVGLLTSISAAQRERVSDALTAGPPQPSTR